MAFEVTGETIRKLDESLRQSIGGVVVTAGCSDGLTRTFETVEALLSYENPLRAKIRSVSMVAEGSETGYASISMMDDWIYNVEFRARADETTLIKLQQNVLDQFTYSRAWYWRLYKVDPMVFWIGALLSGSLLLSIPVFLIEREDEKLWPGSLGLLLSMYAGVIVVSIALATAFTYVRSRWFPRASFIIGQEQARHETRQKVQWGIVVTGILSLITSVAVGLIT